MRKSLLPFALLLSALFSCNRENVPGTGDNAGYYPDPNLTHDQIVLGEKLEDPYAIQNITKALAKLYPTKAGREDLTPTDLYVRFLPTTDDEVETLTSLGVHLTDHPLDYRIVVEGDWYHDPSIDDEDITWQYAVVPHDFVFPEGIAHELLDECYIAENDMVTRGDGIDWEAVEREAYIMTGNGDMIAPETKAASYSPSGRITMVDPDFAGGKPIGVSGVRVSCNSFVKFAHCYTDRDGYYQMSKKFSAKPRYRLVFKNSMKFSIGMNLILVPASVSTLGKGSPEGLSYTVTGTSEDKLFRRCAVNNAAYDYFSRCGEDDLNIKTPPNDTRFWIFKSLGKSAAPMLHHGAVVENGVINTYLRGYGTLLKCFLPDIIIGTKESESFADIYATTVHELSHATHYSQVGNGYWEKYIFFILSSSISSSSASYGSAGDKNAGYCEIGEMWAYFMESKLFKDRYGGSMPEFGTSWWFYPQIFRYLYERGFTCSEICAVLNGEAVSRETLQAALIEKYPDRQALIEQVFERYR